MGAISNQKINTEQIAYWFFRLNGCLSLVNFLTTTNLSKFSKP